MSTKNSCLECNRWNGATSLWSGSFKNVHFTTNDAVDGVIYQSPTFVRSLILYLPFPLPAFYATVDESPNDSSSEYIYQLHSRSFLFRLVLFSLTPTHSFYPSSSLVYVVCNATLFAGAFDRKAPGYLTLIYRPVASICGALLIYMHRWWCASTFFFFLFFGRRTSDFRSATQSTIHPVLLRRRHGICEPPLSNLIVKQSIL